MKFETKLYFNGLETKFSNKTGKNYAILKLYDYDSNAGYDIFCTTPDKFKDYKTMQQYNFNLQVTKQNELITLRLVD